MAKTMLELAWKSFGLIGDCLAHEMIGSIKVKGLHGVQGLVCNYLVKAKDLIIIFGNI